MLKVLANLTEANFQISETDYSCHFDECDSSMYVTFNNGDGDMDSEFSGFYVIDGLLEGSKLVCIK